MKEIIYQIYDKYIPNSIKNRVKLYKYKWRRLQNSFHRVYLLHSIKKSNRPIKVLFVASSLPMWRWQGLFDLLNNDYRFQIKVIIAPFNRFKEEEAKRYSKDILHYLLTKGVNKDEIVHNIKDIDYFLNSFDPDIIFPCQPYGKIYDNKLDYVWNRQRLYCYSPYSLLTVNEDFAYNNELQNLCWKFYLPTPLHYETARRMMANKAKNVVIVGEPDFDRFQECNSDPWKETGDGRVRKRIIWAPHFAIHSTDWLNRASFLWLFEEMLKIAQDFQDSIQIAFKPHPNLYSVLVKDWGKEKTDEYYHKWNSMKNTQLEEGNFIDLFKYSDAMIHDSGSFTGEYMFVNKPVMFTTQDIESIRKRADDFGQKCLDLHYIGKNIEDIRTFIEQTVLKDKDYMQEARSDFYKEYLMPPNNTSVAMNIYNDLLDSLGFSKPQD